MQPARPLRDVLTDLIGDADPAHGSGGPAEALAAGGHPGLSDELMAEAVGSFADTTPVEVAEQLAPYVMANSPVPLPDQPATDPDGWYDALTGAVPPDVDPAGLLDPGHPDPGHPDLVHPDAVRLDPVPLEDGHLEDGARDLGFGQGHHQPSTVDDGRVDTTPAAAGTPDTYGPGSHDQSSHDLDAHGLYADDGGLDFLDHGGVDHDPVDHGAVDHGAVDHDPADLDAGDTPDLDHGTA